MAKRRNASETSETISVEEAGRRLGIGRNMAYEAARRGDLPTIRIGKRILVVAALVDQMLSRKVEPRPATKTEAVSPMGESEEQNAVFSSRLSRACRNEVERLAKVEGRTISRQIEHLIWQGIEAANIDVRLTSFPARLRKLADDLEKRL